MKNFKLDQHPKIKDGFTVPDAYFEQLSQKVLDKAKREPQVITLKSHRTRYWSYAAAAAVVLTLGSGFFRMLQQTNRAQERQNIENYLAFQFTTEENLVQLLDADDLHELESDAAPDAQILEDNLIHNPNLENYLIQ